MITNNTIYVVFSDDIKHRGFQFWCFVRTRTTGIGIFPNPATTDLTISFATQDETNVKIEFFNVLGDLISTDTYSNFSDSNITIDISSYTPGLYLLKLTLGEKEFTRRVVIEN